MALGVAEIMARAGLGSGDGLVRTTLTGGLSHRVLRAGAAGTPYVPRPLNPTPPSVEPAADPESDAPPLPISPSPATIEEA